MRNLMGEVWLFVAMFIIALAFFGCSVAGAPPPRDETPCGTSREAGR